MEELTSQILEVLNTNVDIIISKYMSKAYEWKHGELCKETLIHSSSQFSQSSASEFIVKLLHWYHQKHQLEWTLA